MVSDLKQNKSYLFDSSNQKRNAEENFMPGGGNQASTYTDSKAYAQRWAEKKVLTWFQRQYEDSLTCTQYLENRTGWEHGIGPLWSHMTSKRSSMQWSNPTFCFRVHLGTLPNEV